MCWVEKEGHSKSGQSGLWKKHGFQAQVFDWEL